MAVDNPSYFSVSSEAKAEIDRYTHRTQKFSISSSNECITPHSLSSSISNSDFFSKITHFDSPPKNNKETVQYSDVLPQDHYLIPNSAHRADTSKRSFRLLLRSLSANAACPQDAQSILLGEPRAADIAPPDHCAPFNLRRRFTHTRNLSENRPRRRTHDRVDGDDFFHTMPLSGNGRRRHSIGAYLTKDKASMKNLLKVTSVPSEVPRTIAPKVTKDGSPVFAASDRRIPVKKLHPVTTLHCSDPAPPVNTISSTGSTQRKKRPRHPSTKEMENIVIISSKESPEAGVWVEYLVSCFDKMMSERARQHYKLVPVNVEDLTNESSEGSKDNQLSKAKLQIIIVCPKLLLHVQNSSVESIAPFSMLQDEKVLAMLLGVDDSSINDDHRKAFPTYEYWQRMVMKDQDTMFVDKFLGTAVDILSKKFRNTSEEASFSIIPKKIKPGQNRVIALLNDPLTNQDVVTVHVEKKGELMQIKSFKKRNPYTLQFDVPDCCLEVSMLVWIKIEKNGVSCGSRQIKCESRLRELDQILRASDNPLEFMCQTLGFKTTDRDQLDCWMLSAFQKNIPPHFNLLSTPVSPEHNKANAISVDEYPTLLHFAARFGLEKLCWQLLECPGGEIACDIRNVRHLTPADLAQAHGSPEIATVLRSFMQMSEFSNMYYYLKNMSEDTPEEAASSTTFIKKTKHNSFSKIENNVSNVDDEKSSLNKMDPFSEDCLQKLESKQGADTASVSNCMNETLYENDMYNNTFINDTSIQKAIENDYLIQPSNKKVENLAPVSRPKQINLVPNEMINRNAFGISSPVKEKSFSPTQDFFEGKNNFSSRANSLTSTSTLYSNNQDSRSVITPTGQDELAEIINDFKNKVFTISEVEKLVLDWRNRNETQQSLKEKQDQLNRMREEYDRLQRRMKEDMKKPTPFERVKKMFSRGKSKGSKSGNSENGYNNQRPNSGLSVHSVSSSSSGRLSTASGVSIGESGTQSDNEDLKMFTRITNIQAGNENHDFDNYLIPPPPRPLTNNTYQENSFCQSPGHLIRSPRHMDTINEKEVFSFMSDDCYVQTCSTNAGKQCCLGNNNAEHNYINMSPV